MAKQYEIPEEKACMVSETAMAYRISGQTSHAMIKRVAMPCTFTGEEFKVELLLS